MQCDSISSCSSSSTKVLTHSFNGLVFIIVIIHKIIKCDIFVLVPRTICSHVCQLGWREKEGGRRDEWNNRKLNDGVGLYTAST